MTVRGTSARHGDRRIEARVDARYDSLRPGFGAGDSQVGCTHAVQLNHEWQVIELGKLLERLPSHPWVTAK